jgi:hypothetical protein
MRDRGDDRVHAALVFARILQLDQVPACPCAGEIGTTIEDLAAAISRDDDPGSILLFVCNGLAGLPGDDLLLGSHLMRAGVRLRKREQCSTVRREIPSRILGPLRERTSNRLELIVNSGLPRAK